MSESKSKLDRLVASLKQERDELKLKMHLAGMDAKSEYDRLSGKCDELLFFFLYRGVYSFLWMYVHQNECSYKYSRKEKRRFLLQD